MVNCELSYKVSPLSFHASRLEINVPQPYVDALYRHILNQHQNSITTYGFTRGTTPLSYIESTFKTTVIDNLKEFFLNHCIYSELLKCIMYERKILSGEPILQDIVLDPLQGGCYTFKLNEAQTEARSDWKRTPFKAPQRKNYKDLDRQVEHFLRDETAKLNQAPHEISLGDWICFNVCVIDYHGNALMPGYFHQLWMKISDEETDKESFELFFGKKKGDKITTHSRFLQNFVNPQYDNAHLFVIEIIDVNPATYFSFDHFKRHFKLKSTKDLHQKLIEVFSYRNDISQRRETAEAALKILRDLYHVQLPESLINQQQHRVLKNVQENPDYHVYKAHPDFKKQLRQLAEKQLKEAIVIDQVGKQESTNIDHEDIMSYFNLIKRPRMKEFIYFDVPMPKIGGQEQPIPYELIKFYALREKTLNHVLHALIKR